MNCVLVCAITEPTPSRLFEQYLDRLHCSLCLFVALGIQRATCNMAKSIWFCKLWELWGRILSSVVTLNCFWYFMTGEDKISLPESPMTFHGYSGNWDTINGSLLCLAVLAHTGHFCTVQSLCHSPATIQMSETSSYNARCLGDLHDSIHDIWSHWLRDHYAIVVEENVIIHCQWATQFPIVDEFRGETMFVGHPDLQYLLTCAKMGSSAWFRQYTFKGCCSIDECACLGNSQHDRVGPQCMHHYVGWSFSQSVRTLMILVVQFQVCCSEGLLQFCRLSEFGMVQFLEVVQKGTYLGLVYGHWQNCVVQIRPLQSWRTAATPHQAQVH